MKTKYLISFIFVMSLLPTVLYAESSSEFCFEAVSCVPRDFNGDGVADEAEYYDGACNPKIRNVAADCRSALSAGQLAKVDAGDANITFSCNSGCGTSSVGKKTGPRCNGVLIKVPGDYDNDGKNEDFSPYGSPNANGEVCVDLAAVIKLNETYHLWDELASPKLMRLVHYINGNVGIGTDNPQTKLHVADGDVRIDKLNGTGNSLLGVDKDGILIRQNVNGLGSSAGTLLADGSGNISVGTAVGDNLGDHTATKNLDVGIYDVRGDKLSIDFGDGYIQPLGGSELYLSATDCLSSGPACGQVSNRAGLKFDGTKGSIEVKVDNYSSTGTVASFVGRTNRGATVKADGDLEVDKSVYAAGFCYKSGSITRCIGEKETKMIEEVVYVRSKNAWNPTGITEKSTACDSGYSVVSCNVAIGPAAAQNWTYISGGKVTALLADGGNLITGDIAIRNGRRYWNDSGTLKQQAASDANFSDWTSRLTVLNAIPLRRSGVNDRCSFKIYNSSDRSAYTPVLQTICRKNLPW